MSAQTCDMNQKLLARVGGEENHDLDEFRCHSSGKSCLNVMKVLRAMPAPAGPSRAAGAEHGARIEHSVEVGGQGRRTVRAAGSCGCWSPPPLPPFSLHMLVYSRELRLPHARTFRWCSLAAPLNQQASASPGRPSWMHYARSCREVDRRLPRELPRVARFRQSRRRRRRRQHQGPVRRDRLPENEDGARWLLAGRRGHRVHHDRYDPPDFALPAGISGPMPAAVAPTSLRSRCSASRRAGS
jgi:hypothetical protein